MKVSEQIHVAYDSAHDAFRTIGGLPVDAPALLEVRQGIVQLQRALRIMHGIRKKLENAEKKK